MSKTHLFITSNIFMASWLWYSLCLMCAYERMNFRFSRAFFLFSCVYSTLMCAFFSFRCCWKVIKISHQRFTRFHFHTNKCIQKYSNIFVWWKKKVFTSLFWKLIWCLHSLCECVCVCDLYWTGFQIKVRIHSEILRLQ